MSISSSFPSSSSDETLTLAPNAKTLIPGLLDNVSLIILLLSFFSFSPKHLSSRDPHSTRSQNSFLFSVLVLQQNPFSLLSHRSLKTKHQTNFFFISDPISLSLQCRSAVPGSSSQLFKLTTTSLSVRHSNCSGHPFFPSRTTAKNLAHTSLCNSGSKSLCAIFSSSVDHRSGKSATRTNRRISLSLSLSQICCRLQTDRCVYLNHQIFHRIHSPQILNSLKKKSESYKLLDYLCSLLESTPRHTASSLYRM